MWSYSGVYLYEIRKDDVVEYFISIYFHFPNGWVYVNDITMAPQISSPMEALQKVECYHKYLVSLKSWFFNTSTPRAKLFFNNQNSKKAKKFLQKTKETRRDPHLNECKVYVRHIALV
jgi:hypothetical protein